MTTPALRAGRRNKQIIIERRIAKTDGRGQPTKDVAWAEYANPWAAIYYGSGSEQRDAAQQQAQQAATFEILFNSKSRLITPGDDYRIRYGTAIWDIRSVAEIGFNEGIRINAVKLAA